MMGLMTFNKARRAKEEVKDEGEKSPPKKKEVKDGTN